MARTPSLGRSSEPESLWIGVDGGVCGRGTAALAAQRARSPNVGPLQTGSALDSEVIWRMPWRGSGIGEDRGRDNCDLGGAMTIDQGLLYTKAYLPGRAAEQFVWHDHTFGRVRNPLVGGSRGVVQAVFLAGGAVSAPPRRRPRDYPRGALDSDPEPRIGHLADRLVQVRAEAGPPSGKSVLVGAELQNIRCQPPDSRPRPPEKSTKAVTTAPRPRELLEWDSAPSPRRLTLEPAMPGSHRE